MNVVIFQLTLYFLYRSAFFFGEIDKPAQGILQRAKRKAVNVGICLEGVYVMDVKEKVSAGLSLVELVKQPPFHTLLKALNTDFSS